MPSFAELKAKAVKAKDSSVSTLQNTKDRYSSVPMKKTNWDPYSKQPPPPPPAHRASASLSQPSTAPAFPPPPVRSTRPPIPARQSEDVSNEPPAEEEEDREPNEGIDTIDWANISLEDKEVFFSWLDEFFGRYFNITIPPRTTQQTARHARPLSAPILSSSSSTPPPPTTGRGPPPKIALWSRPTNPGM